MKGKRGSRKRSATAHLVVSDDSAPKLPLRAGMKFEVHATTLVEPTLKGSSKKLAARLCGGTSTCIALVKL